MSNAPAEEVSKERFIDPSPAHQLQRSGFDRPTVRDCVTSCYGIAQSWGGFVNLAFARLLVIPLEHQLCPWP